MLTAWL